jgi:large subunit ribosomal protein L32e
VSRTIPQHLTDLTVVDEQRADELRAAGYESVEHVSAATVDQLTQVPGVRRALAGRMKRETADVPVSEEVVEAVASLYDQQDEEPDEPEPSVPEDLEGLAGVDWELAQRLRNEGFTSVEHVAAATPTQLSAVEGIRDAFAQRLQAETAAVPVSDEVRQDVENLPTDSDPEEPTPMVRKRTKQFFTGAVLLAFAGLAAATQGVVAGVVVLVFQGGWYVLANRARGRL